MVSRNLNPRGGAPHYQRDTEELQNNLEKVVETAQHLCDVFTKVVHTLNGVRLTTEASLNARQAAATPASVNKAGMFPQAQHVSGADTEASDIQLAPTSMRGA